MRGGGVRARELRHEDGGEQDAGPRGRVQHGQDAARVVGVQLVDEREHGAAVQVPSQAADCQDDGSEAGEGGEVREATQQDHAHTGRHQRDQQTALHPAHVPVQQLAETGEEERGDERAGVRPQLQIRDEGRN